MGLFSKIKDFLRGPIYRINREVLADYMNNEIQFSVENNLSACGEFYLSPSEDEPEEHIIITNNDAPCKCPMESEKDFTGITPTEVHITILKRMRFIALLMNLYDSN